MHAINEQQPAEAKSEDIYRQAKLASRSLHEHVHKMGWIILALILFLLLIKPILFFVLIFPYVGFFLYIQMTTTANNWLLRKPIFIEKKSRFGIYTNKNDKAGLINLGNEQGSNKALWLSKSDLVTHALILGQTGSGKTELLLSLLSQFAMIGSGFIFCDAKGDLDGWFKLYSMARSLGFEDNLLVLNFSQPSNDTPSYRKSSNMINLFEHGTADSIMEMLNGFMGESSGESSMWRGRAISLGQVVLRALCELRDHHVEVITIERIRFYFQLSKIEELTKHPLLSDKTKQGLQFYLNELPGWTDESDTDGAAESSRGRSEANKQHGYLTMQFTGVFEMLSGAYAHITQTEISEVDFYDVIVNRRMLYIILPSLEKSPESLKSVGQIIVTQIRQALSKLLGASNLSGTKNVLLDIRPSSSSTPFAIVLDEFGSYAVSGTAQLAAQARSLGICMMFASQDIDSMMKHSESEAKGILSNTRIKIVMKTDSEMTTRLAQHLGGDKYIFTADRLQVMNNSLFDATFDTGNYGLQKVHSITLQELASQSLGECKIFFDGAFWSIKGIYANFPLANQVRINHFIKPKINKN